MKKSLLLIGLVLLTACGGDKSETTEELPPPEPVAEQPEFDPEPDPEDIELLDADEEVVEEAGDEPVAPPVEMAIPTIKPMPAGTAPLPKPVSKPVVTSDYPAEERCLSVRISAQSSRSKDDMYLGLNPYELCIQKPAGTPWCNDMSDCDGSSTCNVAPSAITNIPYFDFHRDFAHEFVTGVATLNFVPVREPAFGYCGTPHSRDGGVSFSVSANGIESQFLLID